MRKMLVLVAIITYGLTSCDEDEIISTESNLKFVFGHHFDGNEVKNDDQFNYVNENKDTLSITLLRYLISDIKMIKDDGTIINVEGYQLVDIDPSKTASLMFSLEDKVPNGVYTDLSFTYGFDSLANLGNYPDLNAASWNWPAMLGGGYHFMQMEGRFIDDGDTMSYAYHNGTARKSMGVFEQNFVEVSLGGFQLNKSDASIEIKMNVAEWYRNPNLWDLSQLNMMLMPNYDAQKLMNENAGSVFSLGDVLQN